jgi:hypothetical protein
MKKNRYKLIVLIFAITAIIFPTPGNSQNHGNGHWRTERLDYTFELRATSNNLVRTEFSIDDSTINPNNNSNSGRSRRSKRSRRPTNNVHAPRKDFRFKKGYIEIKTLKGATTGFTTLSLSNSDKEIELDTKALFVGDTYKSKEVDEFLFAMVEVMRKYGNVTVYVDGRATTRAVYNLSFYLDVEVNDINRH